MGVPYVRFPMGERTAIASVRQRNQHAYARLIGRYKHMVFKVCSRLLRHREDAEEATQDVFVKAYQHSGGYHGG